MEVTQSEISVAKPFECTICPKSFVHESSLEDHILNKHVDDSEFQCTKCLNTKQLSKSFATQRLLSQHIIRVHGPPRFKCQVCFKTSNDSSFLPRHKRIHSQTYIKRHKCDFCSKAFRENSKLLTHLFLVHKHKRKDLIYLKCDLCSQEFECKSTLERHVIDAHVVDKDFECPVCSKTFIDHGTLEKHKTRHDRQIKYFCDVCSQGFKVKNSLVRHLGVTHNHFFYCDNKCLRSFKNKSDFDAHYSDSKQELKCYICQQLINSECNLKIHTDSHVKEIKAEKKEIKVENQIEQFETNKMLERESIKESNSERFQCDLCSKTFDRETYFTAHRNQVHPKAEWKCYFEKCFKSFKQYSYLRLHKMEHAETKEFVCNICQKSFYRPDNLRKHKQMHLKDKKFKCKMCPKSFSASTPLRTHMANNHGGLKPFKCPFVNCGTAWASNQEFQNHLVSHETDKSFKCQMCTTFKAFKSARQLKEHQRRVHSGAKKIKARKSQSAKYSDVIVFACSSNTCSFETASDSEVALHYNQQHQLPKVIIFRKSSPSSSFPLLVSQKIESYATKRMIQTRNKCRICTKLFKFPSQLASHQLTHSNETPFKCTRCPKSFTYNKNLNRHIRERHRLR